MRASKTLKGKSAMQVPASARMDGFRYSPVCVPQMIEVLHYD